MAFGVDRYPELPDEKPRYRGPNGEVDYGEEKQEEEDVTREEPVADGARELWVNIEDYLLHGGCHPADFISTALHEERTRTIEECKAAIGNLKPSERSDWVEVVIREYHEVVIAKKSREIAALRSERDTLQAAHAREVEGLRAALAQRKGNP